MNGDHILKCDDLLLVTTRMVGDEFQSAQSPVEVYRLGLHGQKRDLVETLMSFSPKMR